MEGNETAAVEYRLRALEFTGDFRLDDNLLGVLATEPFTRFRFSLASLIRQTPSLAVPNGVFT